MPWLHMALGMLAIEAMKAAGRKEVCLSNNTCRTAVVCVATQRCGPTEVVLACTTRPQVELLGVSSSSDVAKGSHDRFQSSGTVDAT